MMKSIYSLLFVVAFLFIGTGVLYSQGDSCSSIKPFCAGGSQLVFQNSHPGNSNQTAAETGPDYGCLKSQPFPSWFYLQIENSGDLEFTISQNTKIDGSGNGLDVDFIVWGPFLTRDDFCSNESLSAEKIIDCSWERFEVENMTIPNAQANEYYVVMITNFEGSYQGNSSGFIMLQQTNSGGGTTDCSILDFSLGDDIKLCGENSYLLDAEEERADSYRWFIFDATSNSYELIPNETGPQLLVTKSGNYRVEVINNVQNDVVSDDVVIEFFDQPVANKPGNVNGCDSGVEVVYDLTGAEADLIGNNSGSYSSKYYLSEEDFQNNKPIPNPENFIGDVQMVFGTIISKLSNCESLPQEINLNFSAIPRLDWNEQTALCIDFNSNVIAPVSLGRDLGADYTYQWSLPNDPDGDGVQNPILVLKEYPSQRTITLTVQNKVTGCTNTYSTDVKIFSPPREVLLEVTGKELGGEGYQVTATATGALGDEATYEYSLNNGPWQQDPVFLNVPGGTHRVVAREINGCGSAISRPLRLIGYPRFFTPNNDGYNDTWNVINDSEVSIKKVLIFDRYGQLIKQLNPASGGWDGTYNNRLMPSDDYWFLLEYLDKDTEQFQQFKGNFTLKR